MNPQQLQTARTALWHQTAPLLTADEAASWLDDLGLCLFLPRHAQLPAPAPSLVEAVHGVANVTPPPSVVAHAAELAARLIDDQRAVPLNLLGTYSEQQDFLITPEVLPWVAAIRGERQWKTAPGNRSSPLVVRTWEALDREGETTAVVLRELLGRELTEAAVLRALIELWTTLRAMPIVTPGAPTRWTLLKHRFPEQLATAANTGQGTAVSALLSIYLRSAVAASAEEAEVFLSPLTARSRIREVLHGMTAARQFGSMSVGPHTLLFVEGSLPENLPDTEEPAPASIPAPVPPRALAPRAPRPPFRKAFPDKRSGRPPFRKEFSDRRPPRPASSKEFSDNRPRRPSFRKDLAETAREPRPATEPPRRREISRPARPATPARPGNRPPAKPWQRRTEFSRPNDGERGPRAQRPGEFRTSRKDSRFRAPKPRDQEERPRQDREQTPRREWKERPRPDRGERPRSGDGRSPQDRSRPFRREEGSRSPRKEAPLGKPRFGPKKFGASRFGSKKFGAKLFSGPKEKAPGDRDDRGRPASGQRPKGRFGKPSSARSGAPGPPFRPGRSPQPGKHQNRGPMKNFRKPNPGRPNPRKNRSQEENPE